jgi:hypothetical protein
MNSDAASNPYMISQPTELWSVLRRICPGLGRKPPAFAQSNVIPEFHPPTAPSPQGIPVDQQRVSPPASQREVLHTRVHTLCDSNASDRSRHPCAQVPQVLTTDQWGYARFHSFFPPDKIGSYNYKDKTHQPFFEGPRPFFFPGDDEMYLKELKTYKQNLQTGIDSLQNVSKAIRGAQFENTWIPVTKAFVSSYPLMVQTQISIIILEIEKLEKKLSELRTKLRGYDEKIHEQGREIREAEEAQNLLQENMQGHQPQNANKEPQALPPGWKPVFPLEGPMYYWNTVDNKVTWDKPVASGTTQPSIWDTIKATPSTKPSRFEDFFC